MKFKGDKHNHTTAVLLFNYSEKQKASIRELSPKISSKNLHTLITSLNKQAQRITRKSGLPFFQFNASSQFTFEEQLYTAYDNLFQLGFEKVIGISNDCPNLLATDLAESAFALEQNDLVLGPAKDGGLYLLGVKRGTISKSEFLNFSWQTKALTNNFASYIVRKNIASVFLKTKTDMDTAAEFLAAFKSHFVYIKEFKSRLYSYCQQHFKLHLLFELCYTKTTTLLRGPPTLFLQS